MFPFYSYALDVKRFLPILALFASCAQPVVPTGGSKDERGPNISAVKISRGTSTNVIIDFDENVVADKADLSILISPATKAKTTIKSIQHGLSITIDTAMPDQFHIQFLTEAVKDLNEKNPMADTILFFQGSKSLDSVPTLYYHSGRFQSSYQLQHLDKLSIYIGKFQTIPSNLHGLPYTKTDKNGRYNLPVFDTSQLQILVLNDNNNNNRIDSGEFFNILNNQKPKPFQDTTQVHFLPTDIPVFNPIAERTYFGYRIFGFKGYNHYPYNDIPTNPSGLSIRPTVTILDTLYMQTDSLDAIPLRPLYSQMVFLKPKKKTVNYSANYQILRNTRNSNLVHIAFSKPIRLSSQVLLLAPNDTLRVIPDSKNQAPFVLTINLPSESYTSISIPDSTVLFTDESYLTKQTLSIPNTRDSVIVSFRKNNSDTAYYLIQVRSKTTSFFQSLDSEKVSLRLPVDSYTFLIFHDQDRNGFISPASTSPLRNQEYHYSIPNYILRKGIDAEETINPQR